MSLPAPCACILLAAGDSKRLGYPKQLLRLHGETLLHRMLRMAVAATCEPICVVLGSGAHELRREVEDIVSPHTPIEVAINADWQSGMSGSLRVGIQRLIAHALPCTRTLVLVCDQIHLTENHLLRMLATSEEYPEKIIASSYNEKTGVPAIFPASCFEEMMNAQGDTGAREVLRQNPAKVVAIAFDEGLVDIDTADDVLRAGLELPLLTAHTDARKS